VPITRARSATPIEITGLGPRCAISGQTSQLVMHSVVQLCEARSLRARPLPRSLLQAPSVRGRKRRRALFERRVRHWQHYSRMEFIKQACAVSEEILPGWVP
jgi:hypothetical protein